MQSLKNTLKTYYFLFFAFSFLTTNIAYIHASFAGEVIHFSKDIKSYCSRYIGKTSIQVPFTTRQKNSLRDAEIVDFSGYTSKFISSLDFLDKYSQAFQTEFLKPQITSEDSKLSKFKILVLSPKYFSDYKPSLNSRNFKNWNEITGDFKLNPQTKDYILMALQLKNTEIKTPNQQPKSLEELMRYYTPMHHTSFRVPKTLRLLLATIHHITSFENTLSKSEDFRSLEKDHLVETRLLFEQQNLKSQVRDMVSSWNPRTANERQIKAFLIELIDLKLERHNETLFEKEYIDRLTSKLRSIYSDSNKVLNSLNDLKKELLNILELSDLDSIY